MRKLNPSSTSAARVLNNSVTGSAAVSTGSNPGAARRMRGLRSNCTGGVAYEPLKRNSITLPGAAAATAWFRLANSRASPVSEAGMTKGREGGWLGVITAWGSAGDLVHIELITKNARARARTNTTAQAGCKKRLDWLSEGKADGDCVAPGACCDSARRRPSSAATSAAVSGRAAAPFDIKR
jgi:hypothetical protein